MERLQTYGRGSILKVETVRGFGRRSFQASSRSRESIEIDDYVLVHPGVKSWSAFERARERRRRSFLATVVRPGVVAEREDLFVSSLAQQPQLLAPRLNHCEEQGVRPPETLRHGVLQVRVGASRIALRSILERPDAGGVNVAYLVANPEHPDAVVDLALWLQKRMRDLQPPRLCPVLVGPVNDVACAALADRLVAAGVAVTLKDFDAYAAYRLRLAKSLASAG